ncbi:MAG: hypothetical protein C5B43_01065 [Verrucomicrobia bacterium]|nr:MAG: hypothetical protein C5B43_01065 [Verrucomicrobiota bacterium]
MKKIYIYTYTIIISLTALFNLSAHIAPEINKPALTQNLKLTWKDLGFLSESQFDDFFDDFCNFGKHLGMAEFYNDKGLTDENYNTMKESEIDDVIVGTFPISSSGGKKFWSRLLKCYHKGFKYAEEHFSQDIEQNKKGVTHAMTEINQFFNKYKQQIDNIKKAKSKSDK